MCLQVNASKEEQTVLLPLSLGRSPAEGVAQIKGVYLRPWIRDLFCLRLTLNSEISLPGSFLGLIGTMSQDLHAKISKIQNPIVLEWQDIQLCLTCSYYFHVYRVCPVMGFMYHHLALFILMRGTREEDAIANDPLTDPYQQCAETSFLCIPFTLIFW